MSLISSCQRDEDNADSDYPIAKTAWPRCVSSSVSTSVSETDFISWLHQDIEMSPNFIKGGKENPTALIQLADRDRILVVRLICLRWAISSFS